MTNNAQTFLFDDEKCYLSLKQLQRCGPKIVVRFREFGARKKKNANYNRSRNERRETLFFVENYILPVRLICTFGRKSSPKSFSPFERILHCQLLKLSAIHKITYITNTALPLIFNTRLLQDVAPSGFFFLSSKCEYQQTRYIFYTFFRLLSISTSRPNLTRNLSKCRSCRGR